MVVVIIARYSKFNDDVVFFFYRFPIVKVYENARIFSVTSASAGVTVY